MQANQSLPPKLGAYFLAKMQPIWKKEKKTHTTRREKK